MLSNLLLTVSKLESSILRAIRKESLTDDFIIKISLIFLNIIS